MGAWDTTSFGNDTARDWLADLMESSGSVLIDEALDGVLGLGDDVIEMPVGEEGVAAAEVVAWAMGQASRLDDGGDELQDWLDNQDIEVESGLQQRALSVVDRVFNEPSELLETWQEAEDFEDWRKSLVDLKDRLSVS